MEMLESRFCLSAAVAAGANVIRDGADGSSDYGGGEGCGGHGGDHGYGGYRHR
jgi:hypothetical protein